MSWWHGAVIYEVYLRSFADGNGDGVGDLPGLRERLPYLRGLGVDALWITPFYPSPMVDHGYDVEDPRGVDPLFGTIDDFDAVVADAHALDLRVLIDVVPNHTSDRHRWFQEALASERGSAARDRYIFRPPADGGGPPNNWRSVFGGPAWTLDPVSGEYWLHLFAPEQPDLNWRNAEVAADAEDTLRFWLDRGVDGFRIDVAHGLFKDTDLRDNPEWPDAPSAVLDFARMEQRHTLDQPEVHDVYRRWNSLVASYDHDPVLLGEVFLWDPARVARYVRPGELHLAFSFILMGQPFEARALRRAISASLGEDGRGATTMAWALSNHDLARHATRYGGGRRGQQRARAAALLLLGLPGTPTIYAGEELGLEDGEVPLGCRQDPIWQRSAGAVPGRDGCRIPMPWRPGPSCGFTADSVEPWLPMPVDWERVCVDAQDRDESSMLSLYRRALARRRATPALRRGGLRWQDAPPDVLVFERFERSPGNGGESVTVAVNTGDDRVTVDVAGDITLASDEGVHCHPGGGVVLPADSAVWLSRAR